MNANWTPLLQSALQRLLDLAKTSDGDGISDVNLLTAIAIFLLHAPSNVVGEAPGLKYPAVNAYVRSFQNLINDSLSRRKVVMAASSVLASADRGVAQPLAQAIASPVLDYLLVDETSRAAKSEGMYADCGNFNIFLSFRFYMKSILGSATSAIVTHYRFLIFMNFCTL